MRGAGLISCGLFFAISLVAASCGPAPQKPEAKQRQITAPPSSPPSTSAQAPDPADPVVVSVAGPWDFAGLKGDPVCRLKFLKTALVGALALEKSADCARDFPILNGVAGWFIKGDGDISLTGENRAIVLTFRQQEDGLYASINPLEETYYLTNQDTADFALPTPRAQIEGRWRLNTPDGKLLCSVVLSADDDSAISGFVAQSGACPSISVLKDVKRFKRSKNTLALLDGSNVQKLALTSGDIVTWEVVHPANSKLLLVREAQTPQ